MTRGAGSRKGEGDSACCHEEGERLGKGVCGRRGAQNWLCRCLRSLLERLVEASAGFAEAVQGAERRIWLLTPKSPAEIRPQASSAGIGGWAERRGRTASKARPPQSSVDFHRRARGKVFETPPAEPKFGFGTPKSGGFKRSRHGTVTPVGRVWSAATPGDRRQARPGKEEANAQATASTKLAKHPQPQEGQDAPAACDNWGRMARRRPHDSGNDSYAGGGTGAGSGAWAQCRKQARVQEIARNDKSRQGASGLYSPGGDEFAEATAGKGFTGLLGPQQPWHSNLLAKWTIGERTASGTNATGSEIGKQHYPVSLLVITSNSNLESILDSQNGWHKDNIINCDFQVDNEEDLFVSSPLQAHPI